ncbi:MAG: serine/threonine-protein phosphatase [Magnetospirillum sp.]|nr:serine/threonine-protein phosphatase [Magnetospirillum sp.]
MHALLDLIGRWLSSRCAVGQPRRAMRLNGFDFAGSSRPRYLRGGDYHDIFVPPDRASMAVAVGDVAGHDALAAHLMRLAGALLKRRQAVPGELAELMEGVNRELMPRMRAGRFMTLFLAVMVAGDRSIHWVSAGHGPVLAYDPEADSFAEVPGQDIPLGIDPDWRYHEMDHVGWSAGALLVVATDGIWEQRNKQGEMYGRKRLMRAVRTMREAPAAAIVAAVEADVDAFRQGVPPGDDATLVVVKAI